MLNTRVSTLHQFILLSGGVGTRKSHSVKMICNVVSKTLLLNLKEPEKPRVFLLWPTSIFAVIIGGTIHSALGIKPGANISGLNNEAKAFLKKKLSEVKLFMIDKISMVSSDL